MLFVITITTAYHIRYCRSSEYPKRVITGPTAVGEQNSLGEHEESARMFKAKYSSFSLKFSTLLLHRVCDL